MLHITTRITDELEHFWEEVFMRRYAGTLLVIAYLAMIVIVEINRQGFLPAPYNEIIPTSHFYAVEFTFTLLLLTEVVSLVFGLTRSFSRSIGIQMEILALILLRDTFKRFTEFSEPLEWGPVSENLLPMVADSLGALLIFVILGVYYRVLQRRNITGDDDEKATFIAYKKLIALGLLVVFTVVGLWDVYRFLTGQETYPFFETFYTILVFTDVLMVLISLRYTHNFAVTFRNFGYAIVTIFIRLSLIAPAPLNAVLGVGTAVFALLMALAYNRFGTDIRNQAKPEEEQAHADAEAAQESQPQPSTS